MSKNQGALQAMQAATSPMAKIRRPASINTPNAAAKELKIFEKISCQV